MGKKFDAIFEAVISRYQVGGYLPGDIVKFRPDYKSTPTYKAMHSQMQKELDELVGSGLNIKVIQVGSRNFNHSAGDHKTADNVVLTVAGDHGGGRNYGSITVSPEMLDIVGAGDPTPTVPDQFYRDDEKYLNGKAEEWKADQQNITRVTDKGNGKNTPTNIKLAGEGTRLKIDNTNMGMIYENLGKSDRISEKDRHRITNVVTKYGLDGNGRFETVGQAISKLNQALSELGYDLDMVSDHAIASAHHTPGSKGSNLLTFRRKNLSGNPYEEEPTIENSRISFNWEDLGRGFEVVAYAS